MLRSIRGEAKTGRSHLTVFREFLNHLDKVNRKAPVRTPDKRAGATARRARKAPR